MSVKIGTDGAPSSRVLVLGGRMKIRLGFGNAKQAYASNWQYTKLTIQTRQNTNK
jgi:hypothetical protein